MRNLERDVSVIGITEEMDRFFVLIAIELDWPKDTFGCFSPRNVRGVSGPNSASEKRRYHSHCRACSPSTDLLT